jgi:hypothetical protein
MVATTKQPQGIPFGDIQAECRLAVTISFMPIPSPIFYYSYLRQKKILPNQPQRNKVKSLRAGMVKQGKQWVDPRLNKAEGKKFHLSTVHATN